MPSLSRAFGSAPASRKTRNGLPPQYAELIELIFRSSHIMVTLKRDELIREGRGGELDELVKATREFQKSILEEPDG